MSCDGLLIAMLSPECATIGRRKGVNELYSRADCQGLLYALQNRLESEYSHFYAQPSPGET